MKIFDAIHGFIELDPLETKLIKTLPFKRLSSQRQLIFIQVGITNGTITLLA